MDYLKEAFQKVKEDIFQLTAQIQDLKKELEFLHFSILELRKNQQIQQKSHNPPNPTDKTQNPTIQHMNSTYPNNPTHSSTDKCLFKPLKGQYLSISTGNGGVSTDRQTDRQTDNPTHNLEENTSNLIKRTQKPIIAQETNTSLVLEQLDAIKKELRFKIKKLTKQEMLVLSSIYQFEEQGFIVDYSLLSQKLSLSESSIRDYIKRIIFKKIPITKEKINNKRIILHISTDLKKLASLNTLIQLREL